MLSLTGLEEYVKSIAIKSIVNAYQDSYDLDGVLSVCGALSHRTTDEDILQIVSVIRKLNRYRENYYIAEMLERIRNQFPEYHKRYPQDRPDFELNLTDIRHVENRIIVIRLISAVGDAVGFAGVFQEIMKSNQLIVTINDPRLYALLRRSFPDARILMDNATTQQYLMNLIRTGKRPILLTDCESYLWMRRRCNHYPAMPRPYLKPNPGELDHWENRFKALGRGLKVGISYRGGILPASAMKRSTELWQWKPIFAAPDCHFINLQYGKKSAETAGYPVCDFPELDAIKDLDGFCSQVAALDLVITIDNSTAFFAGALGIPCWLLLPYEYAIAWMRGFEDSPAFPSIRIYRQQSQGEWPYVFHRVERDLRKLVETGIMPQADPELSYRRVFDLLEGNA